MLKLNEAIKGEDVTFVINVNGSKGTPVTVTMRGTLDGRMIDDSITYVGVLIGDADVMFIPFVNIVEGDFHRINTLMWYGK